MTPEPRTDGEGRTPADVREDFQRATEYLAEDDPGYSPFRALFDPSTRAAILDALMVHHPQKLTASEICESADISTTPFYDQVEYLLDAGVVKSPGKKGNATVYTLATDHPTVQLLMMAKLAQKDGVAPMLLSDQFVGSVNEVDQHY